MSLRLPPMSLDYKKLFNSTHFGKIHQISNFAILVLTATVPVKNLNIKENCESELCGLS